MLSPPPNHACLSGTVCTCSTCVVVQPEHAMHAAIPNQTDLVPRACCGQGWVGDVAGRDHPWVNFKQSGSCSVLHRQAAQSWTTAAASKHAYGRPADVRVSKEWSNASTTDRSVVASCCSARSSEQNVHSMFALVQHMQRSYWHAICMAQLLLEHSVYCEASTIGPNFRYLKVQHP
jgi:hypothetical protein